MKKLFTLTIFTALLINCTPQDTENDYMPEETNPAANHAVAEIYSLAEDDNISGTVRFDKVEEGVRVTARVYGLEPGPHGFHIHEYGDCTASDGTSAGGHFAPEGNEHGSPTQDNRHMGDMGNLEAIAGAEYADINYVDTHIDINQILGRGIIIHAGEDDLESQPSGAAGDRIACGVIGLAQPQN